MVLINQDRVDSVYDEVREMCTPSDAEVLIFCAMDCDAICAVHILAVRTHATNPPLRLLCPGRQCSGCRVFTLRASMRVARHSASVHHHVPVWVILSPKLLPDPPRYTASLCPPTPDANRHNTCACGWFVRTRRRCSRPTISAMDFIRWPASWISSGSSRNWSASRTGYAKPPLSPSSSILISHTPQTGIVNTHGLYFCLAYL